MAKLIIEGPTKLHGVVKVAGSKNAALPIIAASLLSSEKVTLTNVPDISDVVTMVEILCSFGAAIEHTRGRLVIHAQTVKPNRVSEQLSGRMRASVLVLGAAIGRMHKIQIARPGGDYIGVRPIDTHLKAFEAMGLKIELRNGLITVKGKPKATTVILSELSVTATENAIMAAVLTKGRTQIRLAATEPHVVDLCNFLNKLGAKISGINSHTLTIDGVESLKGGSWPIIPDHLEAGTLAIAAAATKSDLIIEDFIADHNDALLNKFSEIGVKYIVKNDHTVEIKPSYNLKAIKLRTAVYPDFQSDLQAPMAVLLTQAKGLSEIFETLYEGRLNYLFELQRMGANTSIRETHTGIVSGPTPLYGSQLISFDIRAGATLILAGLVAEGRTVIDRIEHIDRGYQAIDERLRRLGANLWRE